MDRVSMQAKVRPISTKSYLKQLRAQGNLPGVIYGKGLKESVPVYVPYSQFLKFLHTHHWENTIIEMEVEDASGNKNSYTVLVQEIAHHPVSDEMIHVDFHQISLTEKIHVRVPVVPVGEAVGMKKGGLLEHMVWELDVECLPTAIPESIEVDVSGLDIGDSIHVSDITPPEGVRILNPPDTAVFVLEYAGGGQETEATEEVSAEPEVIKKGKEESEAK